MSEQIGALRARVSVERPVRTPDAMGGAALTWVHEGDAWAAIAGGSAGQGAAFDAAQSLAGYTLTINRRADVRAGWRVIWGGRTLRIAGVRDEGAARIDLICEEERL